MYWIEHIGILKDNAGLLAFCVIDLDWLASSQWITTPEQEFNKIPYLCQMSNASFPSSLLVCINFVTYSSFPLISASPSFNCTLLPWLFVSSKYYSSPESIISTLSASSKSYVTAKWEQPSPRRLAGMKLEDEGQGMFQIAFHCLLVSLSGDILYPSARSNVNVPLVINCDGSSFHM